MKNNRYRGAGDMLKKVCNAKPVLRQSASDL